MTPQELREKVHGIIHDFTGEGSEEAADAAINVVLDAAADEIDGLRAGYEDLEKRNEHHETLRLMLHRGAIVLKTAATAILSLKTKKD